MQRLIRKFIFVVTQNNLCTFGSALTTASAVVFSSFFILELFGFHWGPYLGMVAYILIPGLFALGLLLIAGGMIHGQIQRKKKKAARDIEIKPFVLDFHNPKVRKLVLLFTLMTGANLIVISTASYKAVHVVDSTAFCGTTCHVMAPEYTAYKRSPHSRVECVHCHVGSGVGWFVKAKMQGSWQLLALAFDLYPRPIPVPVHTLRPARDTCENCHWPEKFVGDRLKVKTHYKEDEANTEIKTVLLLKVGGIQGRKSRGIHWHNDRNVKIRYLADKKRETIYDVELTQPDGTMARYSYKGENPKDGSEEWREMDCVDCHNRPTHIYQLPADALDQSIQEGRISRSLPFVRREGLRLLKAEYRSHEEARRKIKEELIRYYRENQSNILSEKAELVDQAAQELGDIFSNNVFPAMKVAWGTYANRLGHADFNGCQRCHDGEHKTAEGKAISDDCDTCHTVLAEEEENPKVLTDLQP